MHITIVCYTFPPSKGIGGRRWAKFSQQLSRKGCKVTVISADKSISPEWHEKAYPGVEFRFIGKHYPEWLLGYSNSLLEKICYNFCTRIVNPLIKHNLFDTAFAWRKPLLSELGKLHQDNPIDVLVATGAPFSLLYFAREFKRLHNEVKYVIDFRDPWTWGSWYGWPTLSARKKKFQHLMEQESMDTCDIACVPTQNMGAVLKCTYSSNSSKVYLLPHAYDPEKFPAMTEDGKGKGFIYGGTLYSGIEQDLKSLDKVLKANPDTDFKWDIYTESSNAMLDSKFGNGTVNKVAFVPEEELFKRIKESAAYLVFFPPSQVDLISTKFFEIIYLGKPILYIGEEGAVGRFIRENRLGVHILPEDMVRELPQYLDGNVPFEKGYFDVTQYSFSTVTDAFIEKLESV